MASMATVLTPISEYSVSPSMSSSRPLVNFSSYLPKSTLRSSSTRSSSVRNSAQTTHIFHGTESTRISDIPLISSSEAMERLKEFRESYESKVPYLAMYSSILGGITTDTAAMVIPMDDHMVHRGHGVFDTAAIVDGYLYELDQHLDRFLKSASMAWITPPFNRETIREILIKTSSASGCRDGSLRYWLSAGPGDFLLSSSGCHRPAIYAVVMGAQPAPTTHDPIKVVTSSIPIKPPRFAAVKSVNYLPNVLAKMEAEELGAHAGIWLDERGFVAEGPNMNVAFVTEGGELLMPRFDRILSGCTVRRVAALAEGMVADGRIKGVRVGDVAVEEGKKAREMMLIGSGTYVRPVVQWDDQVIGHGNEGPVTLALLRLLLEDMRSGPDTVRIPIPY